METEERFMGAGASVGVAPCADRLPLSIATGSGAIVVF